MKRDYVDARRLVIELREDLGDLSHRDVLAVAEDDAALLEAHRFAVRSIDPGSVRLSRATPGMRVIRLTPEALVVRVRR